VLPFLPFSAGEQAVVAHKYVIELQNKVRRSVVMSGDHRLVGHVILHVKQSGAICKAIAAEGYDADQGARSLKSAVETRIEDQLVHKYLEEDREISEDQPLVEYAVDISRAGQISVFKSKG
jgi:ATP-dependent Clp protease ATP-binding subunit ClpA